jgi:hypothetical protein
MATDAATGPKTARYAPLGARRGWRSGTEQRVGAIIKTSSRRRLQGRPGYIPANQTAKAICSYTSPLLSRTYSFACELLHRTDPLVAASWPLPSARSTAPAPPAPPSMKVVSPAALTLGRRRPRSLASAATPAARTTGNRTAVIDRGRQAPGQRRLGVGGRGLIRHHVRAVSELERGIVQAGIHDERETLPPPGVGSLTCSTATRRSPAVRRPAPSVRYSVRTLCSVAEEGNQPGARTRCASSAAGARRRHGGPGADRACHPGRCRVRG